jgi:hypothetical protein
MKMLVLLLFTNAFGLFGQDTISQSSKDQIVDSQLKNIGIRDWHYGCTCGREEGFPGGVSAFHSYLQTNLNLSGIPKFSEKSNKKLYVSFIVTEYGDIEDVEVRNSDNREVIREIERVFYQMPIWIPSQYNCENVTSRVRIPIRVDWR